MFSYHHIPAIESCEAEAGEGGLDRRCASGSTLLLLYVVHTQRFFCIQGTLSSCIRVSGRKALGMILYDFTRSD